MEDRTRGSIADLYVIEARGGAHGNATGREIGIVCRFRRCADIAPAVVVRSGYLSLDEHGERPSLSE